MKSLVKNTILRHRTAHLLLVVPTLMVCVSAARSAPPAAAPKTDKVTAAAKNGAFIARFPRISAIPTRIGNSSGGTTRETPLTGHTKELPGGFPIRLAIPGNADRIGLEYAPDKKTFYIRVHSYWNEGGWHDTFIDPNTGKVVGGMFDVPFPRMDYQKRTPTNAWEFGIGWWMEGKWPAGTGEVDAPYRQEVPFKLLKPGADSGVPGFTWKSDDGGLVITTPKTKIYGLVGFETAVTDPTNENLTFTEFNSYTMNWSVVGNGREVTSFRKSFDYAKYPTDPRRTVAKITHPGPLAAVRVGGQLYVMSGENEVIVHRWDAATKILVPVAALYVRPDQIAVALPDIPKISWGQGLIARAGNNGNFAKGDYEVFDANKPFALWNGAMLNFDPEGNTYFLPRWKEIKDAGDGALWKTFDTQHGVYAPENLSRLVLPDVLKTAPACVQIRIDWKTGDLFAAVRRGGEWLLERYPNWKGSKAPASMKPLYSTGPICLTVRGQYEWYDFAPPEAFGSMMVLGDYVFIAEAQEGGVRIHRISDGSIVGRVADRLHVNGTIDTPTQVQVTKTPTEYRVFLLDFQGKSALVWRIKRKMLGEVVTPPKAIPNAAHTRGAGHARQGRDYTTAAPLPEARRRLQSITSGRK